MPILLRLGTSGPPSPKKKWSGHKMQTPTFRPSSTIFRCRLHQDVQWIFIIILLENFHDLSFSKKNNSWKFSNRHHCVLKWCLAFQRRTPKNSWSGKTWQNEVASLAVLNRYSLASPPVSCTGRCFGTPPKSRSFYKHKVGSSNLEHQEMWKSMVYWKM